jgi:outer membrane protein OmpA-like peptidoglycan-associated protein
MPSRLPFHALILAAVVGATAFARSDSDSIGAQDAIAICSRTAESFSFSRAEAGRHPALKREFLNSMVLGDGQTSRKSTPVPAPQAGVPREEVFVGYSHVRFGVPGSSGQTSFNFDGGSVGLSYNLNRWLGVAGEFSLYSISGLPSASSRTYLFGPRFSRRSERFHLYVQSLFGGAQLKSDTTAPPSTTFFGNTIHATSFAAALGGGFDVRLNSRLSWRVLQGEYLLTRFNQANTNSQNNIGVSTGLVFRFGKLRLANHSPAISIAANPAEVIAGSGETAVVRASASDPDDDQLTYTWSASGGEIVGTGDEARWSPGAAPPGMYTIRSKVEDGRGGTAEASTIITVRPQPNRPPTVHCEATPTIVVAGERVTIAATATDPDDDPLTFSFDAQGKMLTAEKSSTIFNTAGLDPGYYTVNCYANDGRGGVATANIDVEVKEPEQKELEARLSLHSIYFPTGMPTRQSPEGGLLRSQQRALLALADDFKNYRTLEPQARLILQGHADPRGGAAYNQQLSELRVETTKAFLVEHGVSPGSVETHGLGIEQPLSRDQVKHAVQQDPSLTTRQKARLLRHLGIVALAQSRRVDIQLSTNGETSVRAFPFNAEDALELLNPRGTAAGKQASESKRTAARKKID